MVKGLQLALVYMGTVLFDNEQYVFKFKTILLFLVFLFVCFSNGGGVEDYKCELNGGGSVMFNLSPPFQANLLHEQIQICIPSTLGP